MKNTIGVKRAQLLREWLSALYGNDERYYNATLWEGIPDGDSFETVMEDLQFGEYDEDIDDTLRMYRNTRKHFEKDGFYYNGNVYASVDTILEIIGIRLPTKILKSGPVYN